jgi:predicted metal-binding protein
MAQSSAKGAVTVKRIGLLTCSNATQDLGCSAVSCLRDLRKRKGEFSRYSEAELIGIINCPGCPTAAGSEKLLKRIRSLTEFNVDAIHLTYCLIALCPFQEKYLRDLGKAFPEVEFVAGSHEAHFEHAEFREKVSVLLRQTPRNMVDIILRR